ncbi:MAG: phosphoribosylanthranilate isomerase [Lachnospiraceae bacterium]|nr:phosphoribosylanthranilate isomerase [Lachnospiraceae bacterium]
MTKIKICGLMKKEDILTVNRFCPEYAGFIIDFPKSHRSKTPEEVRELTGLLDASIVPVGVFVNRPKELILELLNDNIIRMAQLHGSEDDDYIRFLKENSGKPIIKAFVIKTKDDLLSAFHSSADEILLDAGYGSGESFDWGLLDDPLVIKQRRFFLAGGLNAENISAAINNINPYAVDISSGVETNRQKDPVKIERIINIIRNKEGV